MRKALFGSLTFVFILGAGFFAVQADTAKSQSGPGYRNVYSQVFQYNVRIFWWTDVSASTRIEYGTSTGNYTTSYEHPVVGTYGNVNLLMEDLQYDTTYYYRIEATDLQGITTYSDEYTFTTLIDPLDLALTGVTVVDVGRNTAYIAADTNVTSGVTVNYGTSSGNLNSSVDEYITQEYPGSLSNHYIFIKDLLPSTQYYFTVSAWRRAGHANHEEDVEVASQEYSLTTTDAPVINSINPEEGSVGTLVVINGSNFGNFSTNSTMRYSAGVGCDDTSSCPVDIISWEDTQIEVRINSSSQSGNFKLSKGFATGSRWGGGNFWTIEGPAFTVTEGDDDEEENGGEDGMMQGLSGDNYLISAFGCTFSTSTQNDDTIQVTSLFTDGSTTDNYLEQVYNLYNDNWGRYPRCSEMQFHLDHSTPIDRLTSWLQEETIEEKYGCNFSTTLADESTIRTKSLFTLDSDTDKYLNQVYNLYNDNWGRYPRCSEMQFHLDHSTPIDRLTNWLTENIPAEDVKIPETSAEITGAKVEFEDSGSVVKVKDETAALSFKDTEKITFTGTTTPNSIVTLEIASDNPMVVSTRSNDQGYWVYTLPGPLDVGSHTVKVSVADSSGSTISESESIGFSVTSSAKASTVSDVLDEAGFNTTTWIIVIIAAIIIVVLLAVISKKKTPPAEPKQ